jgi:hypothetical protein
VTALPDGDELVATHLPEHQKIRNIRRDARVAVSFEGMRIHPPGLKEYLGGVGPWADGT